MDKYRFRVEFLEEANEFLDRLNEKTDKIPKNEIERAEKLRVQYFNEKRNENL